MLSICRSGDRWRGRASHFVLPLDSISFWRRPVRARLLCFPPPRSCWPCGSSSGARSFRESLFSESPSKSARHDCRRLRRSPLRRLVHHGENRKRVGMAPGGSVVGACPVPATPGFSRTGGDGGRLTRISTQDCRYAARWSDLPARDYCPRFGVVGGASASALADRDFSLGGRSIDRCLCCAAASRTVDLQLSVPEPASALLAGRARQCCDVW